MKSRLTPHDLIRMYPEIDFLVAEGSVSSSYMVAIHQAFYQFAANQMNGGLVLDAACGTGFGTDILARRTARVIGVDIKDKLIQYAKDTYKNQNSKYMVMDVNRTMFEDRIFDVVVADELLEHLPDHSLFLNEATRVLKPDGLFICATVNRLHSFYSGNKPLNRNHFREFDMHEFRQELKKYFEELTIVGQGFGKKFEKYMYNKPARLIECLLLHLNMKHKIPAAWRAKIRSRLTGVSIGQSVPEEFQITSSIQDVENALYLIALARKPILH